MALKILPKVNTVAGLSKNGCYIQITPYLPFDLLTIPVDRGIWANKADFKANVKNPTIAQLVEIRNSYVLDPELAGQVFEGKNILYKMLMWANKAVKDIILADNPTWTDADIEIVDIPKV